MTDMGKKILKRLMGLLFVISVSIAAVWLGGSKAVENVITASVLKDPYEPPIIILDAGHGGCS